MNKRFSLLILPFFLLFFFHCGTASNDDIKELLRIRSGLKNLENLEKKMQNGQLKPEMIAFMGENLTLERPYEIKAAFGEQYLALFREYLIHLEESSLKTVYENDPLRLSKLEQKQRELRNELLNTFFMKLYRLEGEQLEELFTIFDNITPGQARQIQYQISEMNLGYYKNIPELTTTIKADETTFVIIKVDLGYERGNKKMQTIINANKLAMTDILRSYCSNLTMDDLDYRKEFTFKAKLIILFNKQLLQYDRTDTLMGIQDVAVIKLQTFELR